MGTSEAHIVYTLNKTGQWLHEHDEKQVMELIKWSKQQLKSVIDTENKRLRELDAQLTQIRIDKENRAKQVHYTPSVSTIILSDIFLPKCPTIWSDIGVVVGRESVY